MIEVRDLRKRFGNFEALRGLSLHVPKQCVYGLVGPNGSGKTTLIRHLTGVYRQDSGEVLVDGQPVYENTAVKSRMHCIPDDVFYFASADIRDMKRFYKDCYPQFDEARFERLAEAFPIDQKRQIRRLSRGMQKQCAFWLAMCCRPELLILDEPVDGLDPVMRRQIWSIILGDVAEYGTTVLVSSHNLRELEDVCDHVGIINQGSLVLERNLSDLQDNIVKVQVIFNGEEPDLSGLNVLHRSAVGRVQTLIVRSDGEDIPARFAAMMPVFYDVLPLTLEEIFIYELGGMEYAVKDIIL